MLLPSAPIASVAQRQRETQMSRADLAYSTMERKSATILILSMVAAREDAIFGTYAKSARKSIHSSRHATKGRLHGSVIKAATKIASD